MGRHLTLVLVLSACAVERPVHPLRLQGFPGAEIEPGLFTLADGRRWRFLDRLDRAGKALELALSRRGGEFELVGGRRGGAVVRASEGFLEIHHEGRLVERPLALTGHVGDTWRAAGARYTVLGYDQLEILGEVRTALVVDARRGDTRDVYWFARGVGWVRIRTERAGRVVSDALLVSFEPGAAN